MAAAEVDQAAPAPGDRVKEAPTTAAPSRRDAYEVLGLPRDATSAQIKCAYRRLALQYHPDKNVNDPGAQEHFKEISYSYGILIDPEKRKQYDISGFEGVDLEGLSMDLDLTRLGTFSTMFFALFSKLGVPFKTSVSIDVLEEALKGTVPITALTFHQTVQDKVEKQRAKYYSLTITEEQANQGIVVRATSSAQSKFKLLYFEKEEDGSLQLVSQEDSAKTGKVTSAGMYFLDFKVCRLDATANAVAMAKNPDAAFFKRLEGLMPCEITRLQEGTHIFAVYGDNFFKSATYSLEAVCCDEFAESAQALHKIESQLLAKKSELSEFEKEYEEALAKFNAVTNRYTQEKQAVKDLLKQWDKIHASFSSQYTQAQDDKATSVSKDQDSTSAEELNSKESKAAWNKRNWFGLKF